MQANTALIVSDHEAAIAAITDIVERVFTFYPFEPDILPANWREILRGWLLGHPLAMMIAGDEVDALQFIEAGLGYRLPWAMEALRVRTTANGDTVGMPPLALEDYELGLAVPAVETGTMNHSASILIQTGSIHDWPPSKPSPIRLLTSQMGRNCAIGCVHLVSLTIRNESPRF
ncbi:FIG00464231: hypothetical protein [Citrobacter europaeus]|nr:FIG00464231: hypothetical protein [Citrobacter europaeus]